MKPLTTWNGVKIGDEFIILEVNPGLMNVDVGDHVYVADTNHTGFAMNKMTHDDTMGFDGYVYHPHMVARYNFRTNQEALTLLEEE